MDIIKGQLWFFSDSI